MRVVKDSLPVILPTLTSIINASFVTGTFPSLWKMAEVTPIPKEGDHEKPNNNRPVSLLTTLSKVCEKVALNQFMAFFESKQRPSTEQSGNKRFHSTETSFIETTDVILEAIDKHTAVVPLDMGKAFDSLNHEILLLKLQDIGLSPAALNWFSSYLSNRFQAVRINSELSDKLPIQSGVPQGSILGPILFNIYVNDLPSVPQCCKSKTYVDDNKLYITFPVQQRPSTVADMNIDLTKIRNWCFDNRLLLNASKTKLMLFGSRQMIAKIPNFNLSLLGKHLVPSRCARDLGVVFDNHLSFSDHTVKTVSSCMSSLTQINRAKHAFDKDLLITIIKGLLFSKMFYCSSVWSNTSATNINKLQAIQNFAVRIVTGSRKFDHITPILKQLRWMPVKDHLFYRDALLTFKCMDSMAPTNLSSRFIKRGTISGRSTRNANELDIPRYKTAAG